MKTLFSGKKSLVVLKGIFMLFIFQLSFLAIPAYSQEQDSRGLDNSKAHYGIQVGLTENKIDLYYTQSGRAYELKQGNHSFYTPGFRIAVVYDYRLNRYFSLRAMPGVSLFKCNWEPGDVTTSILQTDENKVEGIYGELPFDVKFHPFRMGNLQPYLTSGLCYNFDFTSLRRDNGSENISRMNAHDFRYTCGLGADYYLHNITLGLELKAGFGLFTPDADKTNYSNSLYFQGGPTFSIGFNIEA
jgi:hypothetical protein